MVSREGLLPPACAEQAGKGPMVLRGPFRELGRADGITRHCYEASRSLPKLGLLRDCMREARVRLTSPSLELLPHTRSTRSLAVEQHFSLL